MNQKTWKTLLVVITDPFAKEQPALVKAVALALRSGARLVLFNSFMIPQPVNDTSMSSRSQIIASAIRERRARLESLAAGSKVKGAKCIVKWDYPTQEAIVRQILKTRPDLLITASHRHGRVARWLLANTDWELIRHCPCPVWFVRSPDVPARPNILIAVDPFHTHDKPAILDERLVHAGRLVGEQFGGHVTLVHACSVPDEARPVRILVLARAKQAVQDLAARHGIDAEDCEVKAGKPEDIISSIERRDGTDLLVLGAVSRSIDTHPVIGNTAERVIDQVACDLLVMKPTSVFAPAFARSVAPRLQASRSAYDNPRMVSKRSDGKYPVC
jgi:universal stress protein E